jgi:PAS domain S-box-containing protein
MLRFKFLRNLLLISLAIAVLMPGYVYFYVNPAYDALLTQRTEDEAVRYASYMVRTLGLENRHLTRQSLPQGLAVRLKPVSSDRQLIKLKIFSAAGEIIFSTDQDEIGTVNERDYFREIVARGQVYSKVVRKNRQTAEGVSTLVDVVETYVPFMANGAFGGAFEVYYDISAGMTEIRNLSRHAMIVVVLMAAGFLLAIGAALYRAFVSLRERQEAQDALKRANEELEQRVDERTRELSDANELLTEQISDRINAQKALAHALEEIRCDREKLDGILGSVPDGVVVADGGMRILHMNVAAEKILGRTLDAHLGLPLNTIVDDEDFIVEVSRGLKREQGMFAFDTELAGEDAGHLRVFQVRVSRFDPSESELDGVILLLREVTREREVERMKSAFLGMAAHELNTPLTTIIGYAELLTSEETSALFNEQQKLDYLQLIHRKGLALGELIDDLLDISRVESGRPLELNYDEFDLAELVGEVVERYRLKQSQYEFDLSLPQGPALASADRRRFEQAVDHLVSNAVKYSPGGGPVRVVLTREEKRFSLVVEDDGIGMNEEQLTHIFDRFYRADSSDTAVQGVGLGMSIVRHIVLAHHGEIAVDSAIGNGTRVVVVVPAIPPLADSAERSPYAVNPPPD